MLKILALMLALAVALLDATPLPEIDQHPAGRELYGGHTIKTSSIVRLNKGDALGCHNATYDGSPNVVVVPVPFKNREVARYCDGIYTALLYSHLKLSPFSLSARVVGIACEGCPLKAPDELYQAVVGSDGSRKVKWALTP